MSATTAIAPTRSPGRVLVVDDSAVIRQAIGKMLKVDFEVAVAGDGEAGWDVLSHATDVAVLITDIEMPRLDGYAFICRVRASDDPRIRDLPIIVITGADDEETKARAFACGATDFITKPLNLAQLQACTQAYMRFERPVPEGDAHDGFLGRRAFYEQGEILWGRVAADGPLALLVVTLDKVRVLYREHGDEQMEAFVGHAAAVLQAEVLGEAHSLARLGGAEFGVLLTGMAKSRVLVLAQRLVTALSCQPGPGGAALSLSAGVASSDEGMPDFSALRQAAEDRLKRAVALGGNRASASALSDTLSGAEELILDDVAPPLETDLEDEPAADALLVSDFLSAPPADVSFSRYQPEKSGRAALMSLDRAVWCIADGREADLEPYLDLLTSDMLALFEFLNARRRWGLDDAVGVLRGSLSSPLPG